MSTTQLTAASLTVKMVTLNYGPLTGSFDVYEHTPLLPSMPSSCGFHPYPYYAEDISIRDGDQHDDASTTPLQTQSPWRAAVSRAAAHGSVERLWGSMTSPWSTGNVRRHAVDRCPVPPIRPTPGVVRFPWMKSTKSHAHQWKAQWAGNFRYYLCIQLLKYIRTR